MRNSKSYFSFVFIVSFFLFANTKNTAQINTDWVKFYNDTLTSSSSSTDILKVMTINDGYLYVSGICYNNTYYYKMVTLKYNSSGNIVWRASYPQFFSYEYVQPNAIKVDNMGNVYIAALYRVSNYSDYAVFKFGPDGQLLWKNIYNGTGQYIDTPFGIAVDVDKNVYVTGKSYKTSDFDIVTIKYNSAGVQQWVASFDSPSHMNDIPGAIKIDRKGDIIIGGSSSAAEAGADYCFVKYNSSGSLKWSYIFNYNTWTDVFCSMVLDSAQNIYATGSTAQVQEDTRICTIKLDTLGKLKWSKTYSRSNGYIVNEPKAIDIDEDDNVYIAGITEKDYSNVDFLTLKYNPEGTEQWHKFYNNNFVYTAMVSGLEVDNFGNSYVTGFSCENDYGYTTIKYDKHGNLKWTARYEQAGNETDNFPHIALYNDNIYISGLSNNYNTGADYLLIKYHQAPDTVIIDPVVPAAYELKQNYPNPFNPSTNFSFDLPEPAYVTIKVYNIQGKEVGTVTDRFFEAGKILVKWNAINYCSGVYFYRIKAGSFTDSKKMIIFK